MRILFLSFYFEPDLSAGSFRNTSLFYAILSRLKEDDFIHVITTQPNRYSSFKSLSVEKEEGNKYRIDRIKIPDHKGGMLDQAMSFITFFQKTMKFVRKEKYDMVYASSSRLFTAFLGKIIATSKNIPLYLDIRDIFVDTMKEVLQNKFVKLPVLGFAKLVERYTFSKASHINLVSEGFKEYFLKYSKPAYSYFPNGIDEVFLNSFRATTSISKKPVIITYAGNIGYGQGLDKIIPMAAKQLGSDYLFRVIGDGGTKSLLEAKLKELNVENVELIAPMSRTELIEYYNDTTFLFLHLNDFDAFKKVLPSKLFEYAAFDKPIIAGVGGFAAQFIRGNISNYILFNPTDVDSLVEQIRNYEVSFEYRYNFIQTYSRKNIMINMTEDIMKLADNSKL